MRAHTRRVRSFVRSSMRCDAMRRDARFNLDLKRGPRERTRRLNDRRAFVLYLYSSSREYTHERRTRTQTAAVCGLAVRTSRWSMVDGRWSMSMSMEWWTQTACLPTYKTFTTRGFFEFEDANSHFKKNTHALEMARRFGCVSCVSCFFWSFFGLFFSGVCRI